MLGLFLRLGSGQVTAFLVGLGILRFYIGVFTEENDNQRLPHLSGNGHSIQLQTLQNPTHPHPTQPHTFRSARCFSRLPEGDHLHILPPKVLESQRPTKLTSLHHHKPIVQMHKHPHDPLLLRKSASPVILAAFSTQLQLLPMATLQCHSNQHGYSFDEAG